MVLGAPVGYPVGFSISIFLRLALDIPFGAWEVSLVVVSLGALGDLLILTREGYFVGLSLVLPLVYPL